MKNFLPICLLALLGSYVIESCTPEEQLFTENSALKLRFSQDTVLFDTIFTTIGSTTKRFQVYNDDRNALNISSIRTVNPSSPYKLTVNGVTGNQFEDLRLLGNDSMLILVEVLIDPLDEDLPFIIEDEVAFETNSNIQSLKLVAWGQDANFLSDSILNCNTIWTSNRPYVIFNSVLIDSLCQLTIEPGTRIYSHVGSYIYVKGTIDIRGSSDNRVLLTNDRLDANFRDAPGQWEGIFFLEGSKDNRIIYTDIRNANYGIWLGTPDTDTIPDLQLAQVRIENMARSGLVAFTSDLRAENLLINNCAEYCIGNFAGGSYSYNHCTFTNISSDFFRQNPVMAVTDNLLLTDQSLLAEDIYLELINSIVWGDFSDELLLNNEGGRRFSLLVASDIIKTSEGNLDTNGNLINQDPLFINPDGNDYTLDSLSPAIDAGLNTGILFDLDGILRDSLPDIGAFEWIPGND